MGDFKTVSVSEAKTLLAEEDTVLLDCRDVKDYRKGHIDSAMLVHEGLKETLIRKGDKNQKMIIYCYFGHASEHLAQMFCDFGFKNVYSLRDGYSAWQESQDA